jgi:hypothetical protein
VNARARSIVAIDASAALEALFFGEIAAQRWRRMRDDKESRLHGKSAEPARCITAMARPLARTLPVVAVMMVMAVVPMMTVVAVMPVVRLLHEARLAAMNTDVDLRYRCGLR